MIEAEFRQMATDGPTEENSPRRRPISRARITLNLDTSTKIARQLVQMQVDNLGIDYVDRRSAMIDAVTLDDARRVAKRLLNGGLLVTVVGRPKGVTARPPSSSRRLSRLNYRHGMTGMSAFAERRPRTLLGAR